MAFDAARLGMFVLDDGEPRLASSLEEWAAFMEDVGRRRVAWTEVGEWRISTVFLGTDHSFGHGPPVLWETMVFGPPPWDQEQWRYTSREAAIAQHDQVVEHVRRGEQPW